VDGLQKTEMLYLLPMKIFSLFFLLLCLMAPGAVLADITNLSDITIPENKYLKEGQLAAEQSTKLFQSQEFQEKLSCEKHRLEKEVFSELSIQSGRTPGSKTLQRSLLPMRSYIFSYPVPCQTKQFTIIFIP